jgi:hypothetical protein
MHAVSPFGVETPARERNDGCDAPSLGDATTPTKRGRTPMRHGFRIAHLVISCLVLAGIVVQPFLIGLYLFGAVDNSDLHTAVGYSLFEFGIPLLLITALFARLRGRELILTLLLMLDIFVQVLLVNLRDTLPVLAAFHPLNAFVLLLLSIAVVRADLASLRQARMSLEPGVASPGPDGYRGGRTPEGAGR